MLTKGQITQLEGDIVLSGDLRRGSCLLLMFNEELKLAYILESELSSKCETDWEAFCSLHEAGMVTKFIAHESVAQVLKQKFSLRQIPVAGSATFKRHCEWRLDAGKASLKLNIQDKIRVLVVDDSKTMQQVLAQVFAGSQDLEVVGFVNDPLEAAKKIAELKPDVMTLDIHMPKMTGLDVLRQIMPVSPIPVVMITSVGLEEGRDVLDALKLGAVDYIQKPSYDELKTIGPLMIEKVITAASVDVKKNFGRNRARQAQTSVSGGNYDRRKVICIGSSTGGTEAIRQIFRSFPKSFPPVLIAQHIPKHFSKAFADSLAKEFGVSVFEATDGQEVLPNQVLIAPGGMQMEIDSRNKDPLTVRVFDGPPVNRHKPSVEVLFNSAAKILGRRAVGVILTGMGGDGAQGLLRMKQSGSHTIAQNEETCVVFGMPRVAIQLGAASKICPLDHIAAEALGACLQTALKTG